MSIPFGASGDIDAGDYGVTADGSVSGMKNRTQTNVEASLKSKVNTSPGWNGADGTFFGSLLAGFRNGITGFISQLFGGLSGTSGGGFLDLLGSLVVIRTTAQNADAKASSVAGSVSSVTKTAVTTGVIEGFTWTRFVYTSNGTFTTPTPAAGKRIAKIASACINGGSGGKTPLKEDRGGEGGVGGGYQYREHTAAAVGASQAVTVGAGASANGVGGTSSFGSLNTGVRDTSAIWTSQGALESANRPGRGGEGGAAGGTSTDTWSNSGVRGESSALAVGGGGGSKGAIGGAGGNPSSDPFYYSGGGGGGGGGGNVSTGPGNRGGHGAAPGGGGGGGGSAPNNITISVGAGGNGGNGSVAVWVYFEDDI